MHGKAQRDLLILSLLAPSGEYDCMITKLVYLQKTFQFQ